jgi:ATP-dependent DNA helicase RecG
MKNTLLRDLLRGGESQHVEFKTGSVELAVIGRTVCAFLNAQGGNLVIGISDSGRILGVANAASRKQEIEHAMDEMISPRAIWSVAIETDQDGDVIIVAVPPGPNRPYTCQSSIYVRRDIRDERTHKAQAEEIKQIISAEASKPTPWERFPALGLGMDDLDSDEIQETVDIGRKRSPELFPNPEDEVAVLSHLGVSQYGRLTNACAVLFARHPQRILPQTRIRATVFERDKGGNYLDNQIYEGNVFKVLENLQSFLKRHTPISSEFDSGSLKRIDRSIYPFPALREALLNAIAHRDYSRYDGGVSVGVYPDRIEIWNSGSLPEGMKIGDLKRSHPSRPQNPDIAYVLYLRMLIERVGRGTLKILDECKAAGLKEPKWSQDALGVTLTIFGRGANENKAAKPAISLNNRQKDLLGRTKPGDVFTLREYHASVADEASERSARRDLNQLVEDGWLTREGATRNQHFIRTERKG